MIAKHKNGMVCKRGDKVKVYKFLSSAKGWKATGEVGEFEELVANGKLVNFNISGKPRQCLPQGLGLNIQ